MAIIRQHPEYDPTRRSSFAQSRRRYQGFILLVLLHIHCGELAAL